MPDTGDRPPIEAGLGSYSPWQQKEIERREQKMVKMGVVSPSDFEWASNIVPAPKKAATGGPPT